MPGLVWSIRRPRGCHGRSPWPATASPDPRQPAGCGIRDWRWSAASNRTSQRYPRPTPGRPRVIAAERRVGSAPAHRLRRQGDAERPLQLVSSGPLGRGRTERWQWRLAAGQRAGYRTGRDRCASGPRACPKDTLSQTGTGARPLGRAPLETPGTSTNKTDVPVADGEDMTLRVLDSWRNSLWPAPSRVHRAYAAIRRRPRAFGHAS